jgi:hypothetical protein
MKLRNKKTGEIRAFDEVMREAYKWDNYNSLAELNEEWEDCKEEQPQQRYYLMNKKTGYIATFNSLDEADTFRREVKGWKFVKVY